MMNLTATHIFTVGLHAALKLALDPTKPAKMRRQAEASAYANARAAARAANAYLDAQASA